MIFRLKDWQLSSTRFCAESFFSESGIEGELNFGHFCETWSKFIQLDIAGIFLYFDSNDKPLGIIGGTATQCTMTGDMIAMECFWWVDPSLRGRSPAALRLFAAFEGWAKSKDCKRIYFGNLYKLNDESMRNLYSRLGYSPIEVHYVKAV